MKILILSFYYQPDLSAGSFRCTALVEQLKQQIGPNYEIEVITTLPNRYSSYDVLAPEFEQQGNVFIKRVLIPKHSSGMLDQARSFVFFAKEVSRLTRKNEYALVFATSSRLMTAVLGGCIARRKKAKFYLDIRDIFVDTINDLLPAKISIFAKPFFSVLEKWSFSYADRINLVSKGFYGYFYNRYPAAELSWYTNGIDSEFLSITKEKIQTCKPHPITVLYAGNIGEGQGLHLIIPSLAKKLEGYVNFRIIGDGGRKSLLKEAVACSSNVELLPPIDRKKLIEEYNLADVLFLHLNDCSAFRKVLPSKLFEYAAVEKPIWAGVSGYASSFIKEEVVNAAVFSPCNTDEAVRVLNDLKLETVHRTNFIAKYSRKNIMLLMARDILSLL